MEIWKMKLLRMGNAVINAAQVGAATEDGTIKVPTWAVAVYNDTTKILVDTGVSDVDWVNAHDPVYYQEDNEKLENALRMQLGWSPDEVEAVIHTHLHYDHCGNDRLFRRAVFYTTRLELETAFQPPLTQKNYYNQELIQKDAVPYMAWRFVEEEELLFPGILAFPTPGHTMGHQSVLVNTEEGAVCICGDVSPMAQNLLNNQMPGILMHAGSVLESYEKIRRRADLFISSHEYTLENGQTSDFPKCIERMARHLL